MTDHGTTSTNVIFGRFGQHRDDAPVAAPLSQPAIRLHFFGMLASFQRGRAGFISNCYLAAIDTGASSSAIAELVDAGVWERSDDGYQVRQLEIMCIASEVAHHLAQQPLSATPASPRADAGAPRRIGFGEINTGHAACRKGADLAAVERVGVSRDDGLHGQRLATTATHAVETSVRRLRDPANRGRQRRDVRSRAATPPTVANRPPT